MKAVAVVIVSYNGERWIRRNLLSLRDSTASAHVILVDNASTDGTAALVRQEFPEVELIVNPRNTGFGAGNNVGIARSIALQSEYTFLLNQDAYVTPTTVAELFAFMDRNPEFGIVSPLHCSPDLSHLDVKTFVGYLGNHAVEFLCDAALKQASDHYIVRGVNAAAWFVRTSVFAKAGGFDPLFFMYGEDDDLIQRFLWHKIPFGLVTGSRAVHLRESPSVGNGGTFAKLRRATSKARSRLIVLVKQPEYGVGHIALMLFVNGVIRPFADFMVNRRALDFLSYALAAGRVLVEIPEIRRRARLCAVPGDHFLKPHELRKV